MVKKFRMMNPWFWNVLRQGNQQKREGFQLQKLLSASICSDNKDEKMGDDDTYVSLSDTKGFAAEVREPENPVGEHSY